MFRDFKGLLTFNLFFIYFYSIFLLKNLFYFFSQVIPESDSESPIIARRQERDWVSQIEDIPNVNGHYSGTTNGFRETEKKAYPLKQTPSFLEEVCDDFERTLERSKTKAGPPVRQVQITDMIDYYSYSSSGMYKNIES